jgi:hypothetical protein
MTATTATGWVKPKEAATDFHLSIRTIERAARRGLVRIHRVNARNVWVWAEDVATMSRHLPRHPDDDPHTWAMLSRDLRKLLSPADAGVTKAEIAAIRATVKKHAELSKRCDEYNSTAARRDYLEAKQAAIDSADAVAIEELGDFESFARRYAGTSENLQALALNFALTMHTPHLDTLRKIETAIRKRADDAEAQEQRTAEALGIPYTPSSGTAALRRALGAFSLALSRADATGIDLGALATNFLENE